MNNNNSSNNKAALLEEIRALSFVKTELELYLDTHPECPTALDYYNQTVNALKRYKEEYETNYAPLFAESGAVNGKWRWVDKPWPWQYGTATPKNEEGRR